MSLDPLSAFLQNLSIEITGKQIEKLPVLAANLKPGTRVFIALIDPADVAVQLAAAKQLKAAGFTPVPHIPARFVRDLDDLKNRIGALAGEASVSEILVLGGGAPQLWAALTPPSRFSKPASSRPMVSAASALPAIRRATLTSPKSMAKRHC